MPRKFIVDFGGEEDVEDTPAPPIHPDKFLWYGQFVRDRLRELGMDPHQELPIYYKGPPDILSLSGEGRIQCQWWRKVDPILGTCAMCHIACPGYVMGNCCFTDDRTRDLRHWRVATDPVTIDLDLAKYFEFHPRADQILKEWDDQIREMGILID